MVEQAFDIAATVLAYSAAAIIAVSAVIGIVWGVTFAIREWKEW